jgi:hypothetical protein
MAATSSTHRAALDALAADLERVFGARFVSLVAYPPAAQDADAPVHSLALVEALGFEDLHACLPLVAAWRRRGLAVPLLLEETEFRRTLDVFPLEYGGILANHDVVRGRNPFAGVRVDVKDLRRACELQAKSHLIHLREGFLETQGDAAGVARLMAASAPPFRALLSHIARLPPSRGFGEAGSPSRGSGEPDPPAGALDDDASIAAEAERRMGISAALVREVLASPTSGQTSIADPTALYVRYLAAAEQVWEYVDAWRSR